jgi:tryptophan-rich sensory protein
MTVYGILLLLNLAWAPLFFGMYVPHSRLGRPLAGPPGHRRSCRGRWCHSGAVRLMLPYVSWFVFSLSLNAYAAASN